MGCARWQRPWGGRRRLERRGGGGWGPAAGRRDLAGVDGDRVLGGGGTWRLLRRLGPWRRWNGDRVGVCGRRGGEGGARSASGRVGGGGIAGVAASAGVGGRRADWLDPMDARLWCPRMGPTRRLQPPGVAGFAPRAGVTGRAVISARGALGGAVLSGRCNLCGLHSRGSRPERPKRAFQTRAPRRRNLSMLRGSGVALNPPHVRRVQRERRWRAGSVRRLQPQGVAAAPVEANSRHSRVSSTPKSREFGPQPQAVAARPAPAGREAISDPPPPTSSDAASPLRLCCPGAPRPRSDLRATAASRLRRGRTPVRRSPGQPVAYHGTQ